MPPKLYVLSLWAEDVLATAHFYRDLIGLRLLPHHGGRPHFDLGGSFLVIVQGKLPPPQETAPERFPWVAFSVEDLDAALERLRAHGVELPWGVESNGSSRWAMFYDPAGNLIELVQN